jgi:2-methylcitrate dehydratase PrpD
MTANATAAARFVATAPQRNYSAEVIDAAKQCLVDWCGVAIGARDEPAGRTVRGVAESWGGTGSARVLLGGTGPAPTVALVNGTLAHCLDYDDTHIGCTGHLSGPTWAAALAVGAEVGASESEILGAFITGFEVGARIGRKGLGMIANDRGWHSTGIVGRFAAAAAAGVLYGLNEERGLHALGAAATQVAGLTGSFGTMSKPLHAGKAAMDGVFAAQIAAKGFVAATDLLEAEKGLGAAIIQDGSATIDVGDFTDGWEITRNTFKPYAACLLTHPAIDAGRSLAEKIAGLEIDSVHAEVNPMAIKLAGKTAPDTPLAAKFSTAFCIALGLSGYRATNGDFCDERVADTALQDLAGRIDLAPTDSVRATAARMEVRLKDGSVLEAETPLALGNPGNPMSRDDMEAKFMPMVEPALGDGAAELLAVLRDFETPGRLADYDALVAGD